MITPFQQIQGLLPRLDVSERKKLAILLGAFSGRASLGKGTLGKPSAAAALEADWLFFGVMSELSRRGLKYRSRGAPDVARLAPNYTETSEIIRIELETALKIMIPQPKRAQLYMLGNVTARALAEYLEGGPSPIGLKTLLNNIDKTLEAIDWSFPDYLRCGMIYCLVK